MGMNFKRAHSYRVVAVALAIIIGIAFLPLMGTVAVAAEKQEGPYTFKLTGPNTKGIVRMTGTVYNGYKYGTVYVDNQKERDINASQIDISIDMKKYDVGYHTVYVTFRDGNGYTVTDGNRNTLYDSKMYVPTKFYTKGYNSIKQYDVYWNHIRFDRKGKSYAYDSDCNLYVTYKKAKAKKWQTKCLPDAWTTYKIPKLTPGKKYKVRTYYGKRFTYNGKEYFWKSPESATKVVKTGKKKMKVKSIKVKAYNVKRHAVRIYGTYTGVYLRTEYYYTYKLKATVKLKKKPGAKGIMINKYRLKGNKKTYTKKLGSFTSYVKPRTQKYIISITSFQNKTYGGWSPRIVKKVKIR